MIKPDILVSQVVEVPLETLWESWADFGGIYRFHDDVIRTTILTPDVSRGVGAVRRCELADNKNEIEERITDIRPMEKIGVEFVRTSLPVEKAHADFLFVAHGQGSSEVEMQFAFTPRGSLLRLLKPLMKRKMRSGFTSLLQQNKRFLEELS